MSNTSAGQLKSIVDRIERLEEEKAAITVDIAEIYKEGSSAGYDAKVLRTLIRRRAKDAAEVEEADALLVTYERALSGGWEGLPLSGVS